MSMIILSSSSASQNFDGNRLPSCHMNPVPINKALKRAGRCRGPTHQMDAANLVLVARRLDLAKGCNDLTQSL